jgi:hypothetical protein
MNKALVCVTGFFLYFTLMFAGGVDIPPQYNQDKSVIVDSLLAVDELSGSIYYEQNYTNVYSNWQGGQTYIGDYYSWAWMAWFASIGYLSFQVPPIPEGYELQNATLWVYIQTWSGNNNGNYPIFDYGTTTVYPDGILEHINYGGSLSSHDVIPSSVYGTYTFFTSETLIPPCWVSYDVTDCLLCDLVGNRPLSQYRIYLQGFSDWDNREDYIVYDSYSIPILPHSVKILYTLTDGTPNNDPSIPRPNLTVSCHPNPFSDRCSITVKAPDPGICKLKIYNIKGQVVRCYDVNFNSSDERNLDWDGRDDSGKQVCGGVYFVVAESGVNTAKSKVLYIR